MNTISEPLAQDARVTLAVEEYLALWDAGRRPDRQEFLARHPDIALALAECLDGLDFIRSAAPGLRESPRLSAADAIQPEGPLGDFRIVREVGRGGMGVVYEAVQISLGRRVALKVLPFASTLDPRQLQRFKNEAQAAAHLHHQSIVPVYATGCERGVHYYAMQFIEGRTLAAIIQELRLGAKPPTQSEPRPPGSGGNGCDETTAYPRLPDGRGSVPTLPKAGISTERSPQTPAYFRSVGQLAVQAAEALEHAHQLGIVHRDIKPANLLVDGRGQLWVTDFGLAHCQSQGGLTMSGDLVGTLRYMSPEQALATRVTVDHRTDIYSLGVTLYELLTLEPAFNGRDRQELLRQIAFDEPRQPRRSNPAIPAEVETIVLKAMEKNPSERYGTAQELADDLERWLRDEPILARRPSVGMRLRKWMRRHRPVVATATVAGVILLMAVTLITLLAARRLREQLAETKEAEAVALGLLNNASRLLRDAGNLTTAEDYSRKALTLAGKLALENHDDPGSRELVANCHEGLGDVLRHRGRWRQAAQQFRQALTIFERLGAEFPDEPSYRYRQARALNSLAKALRPLPDERATALQSHHQAIGMCDQLVAEFPDQPRYGTELVRSHFGLGIVLRLAGRPVEAAQAFQHALDAYRPHDDTYLSPGTAKEQFAAVHNEWAWMLATWPDVKFRDPPRAVALARKAVELAPEKPNFLNTLGVAEYRVGNWKEAIAALEKSEQLAPGKYFAFNAFFLAMAHCQLGYKEHARKEFEQAVKWMEKKDPKNDELLRFRDEAKALLRISHR
jgi:serine/threonine protein kinase/Flp pilus assembly protein TadD